VNVPEFAGTYIPSPSFTKLRSDLMGSSEPSIWLRPTRLQAFHPSSQMGEIDAAPSVHGVLYICSSILRLANGASPPRIQFKPTSLHTCCLYTIIHCNHQSDALSRSQRYRRGAAQDT
jgi:hypothetical protein